MTDVLNPEVWRSVDRYPGYEVSDLGRVRSTPRVLTRINGRTYSVKGKVRRQQTNKTGYLTVRLRDCRGIGKTWEVHVLVALVFLGDRPAGLEVRHLDGNCLNNAVVNLAYGTHSENILDAVAHGTHGMTRRTHCVKGHPLSGENLGQEKRQRVCLACQRAAQARYRARRRDAA